MGGPTTNSPPHSITYHASNFCLDNKPFTKFPVPCHQHSQGNDRSDSLASLARWCCYTKGPTLLQSKVHTHHSLRWPVTLKVNHIAQVQCNGTPGLITLERGGRSGPGSSNTSGQGPGVGGVTWRAGEGAGNWRALVRRVGGADGGDSTLPGTPIWRCWDVTRASGSNTSGALRTLLAWAPVDNQLTVRVEQAVARSGVQGLDIEFPGEENTSVGVRAKQLAFFFSINSWDHCQQVVFTQAGEFSFFTSGTNQTQQDLDQDQDEAIGQHP